MNKPKTYTQIRVQPETRTRLKILAAALMKSGWMSDFLDAISKVPAKKIKELLK